MVRGRCGAIGGDAVAVDAGVCAVVVVVDGEAVGDALQVTAEGDDALANEEQDYQAGRGKRLSTS